MGIKKFISKLLNKQEAPQEQESRKKPGPPRKRYHKKEMDSSQEVWRPGSKTTEKIPAKKGGQRRKPRGDGKPQDERKPRDEKSGERKPRGDRPRQDRKPRDGQQGDRKPRGDRQQQGGRKPQGERKPRAERPPRERKPKAPLPAYDASTHVVEPQEGKVRFHDLGLPDRIMQALQDMKFDYCTPIQAETLPATLKGKDLFGKAQTGTGKTAAFLIQMFTKFLNEPLAEQRRKGTPRGLILAPTRELAMQIKKDADALAKFSGLRTVAVYGGMDYAKQQQYLDRYVDLVVATPGRLIDFQRNKVVDLRKVEVLVIDEADRMLDMGFIPDVRRIVFATPHKERRQTLLFSATLDEPVTRLASSWMVDPMKVEIEPESLVTDTVDQKVYVCTDDQKFKMLFNTLQSEDMKQCIIFTNRRDQAERLSDQLRNYGIDSSMLSGAVNQKKRVRILEDFMSGKKRVVVATDVAGRGIHVNDISHVVNYNIPQNPEDYVHRIGRTGRAGHTGTSITFACEMESFELPAIEELLGEQLACERPTEEMLKELPAPTPLPKEARPRQDGDRRSGNRSGGSRNGGRSGGHSGNRSGNRSRSSGGRSSGARSGERRDGGDRRPSTQKSDSSK